MYFDHKLSFGYDKCLLALSSLQKKASEIENSETEDKTKIQALSISKKCIINKIDLLTSATLVKDVMQFVQQSKEKL